MDATVLEVCDWDNWHKAAESPKKINDRRLMNLYKKGCLRKIHHICGREALAIEVGHDIHLWRYVIEKHLIALAKIIERFAISGVLENAVFGAFAVAHP